jgi:hypothetical protein
MLTKMKTAIFLLAVVVATVIACSKENQQGLKNTESVANAEAAHKGDSTHLPGDSTHLPGDSTHLPGDSTHLPGDSTHFPGDSTHLPTDSFPHYPHYPHDSTGVGDSTGVPPVDTMATRRMRNRH